MLSCKHDNGVTPNPGEPLRIQSVTPSEFALGAKLGIVQIAGTGFSSVQSVDFGEGTKVLSADALDSHRLEVTVSILNGATPGRRTVTVSTAAATAQLANAIVIRNNEAPKPSISVSPDPGSINTILQLDASESSDNGSIVDYLWEFSDGGKKHGVNAKYQFTRQGTYTIRLTATDNRGGISSAEREIEIVDDLPPVISFVVDPPFGTQNTMFTFDASSSFDLDGTIDKFQWDFSDGSVYNKPVVHHKFPQPGHYQITLLLIDNEKKETTEKHSFKVKLFDVQQATKEISQVVVQFLHLFNDIETLTAEQIVVGFSSNPGCPGRQHEINVINNKKPIQGTANNQILGSPVVTNVTETKANADLTARFYGTDGEGNNYSSVFVHHFQMINDGTGWKICNFTVD